MIFRAVAVLLLSFSVVSPAIAQTRFPDGLVGFYANFVRSMNPRLALSDCQTYAQDLLANAQRLRLDPALLAAIVTVESHWNPSARSWRGAEGLGQLMPATAQELGVDPRSGRDNLLGTSIYLHRLLGQFGSTREPLRFAVASYNAGPGTVIRYGGVPPISETQHYVVKVMRVIDDVHAESKLAQASPPLAPRHKSTLESFDSSVVAYWGAR